MSHSTPVKPSSRTGNNQPSSDALRKQEVLKNLLQDEIGDQTWQFDAERVSRMLSPKCLKPGGDYHFLDNHDCDVDKRFFKAALTRAKSDLEKTLSWNKVSIGRPTMRGSGIVKDIPTQPPNVAPETTSQGAPSLKAFTTAPLRRSPRLRTPAAHQPNAESSSSSQIKKPSSKQTKKPPSKTTAQAKPTTAEGTPSEGTTKNEKTTQSESCPITPYKRENDIGYFEPRGFTPSHETQDLRKEFQKPLIVKISWQQDELKEVEPGMYKASNGRFGTVSHLCSKDEIESAFWKLFRDTPPIAAETRTMCYSFFSLEGRSLVEAESSRELCEALIHGVIGNLLLCPNSVEKSAFKIAADFRQTATKPAQDLTSLFEGLSIDSMPPKLSDLEEQMTRVERLVKELGASTKCIAFVTDGDKAICWASYFQGHNRGSDERSGTSEFMSPRLLESIEDGTRYLQSPVDDLFSVYWVALWAILNNIPTSRRSDYEVRWRRKIAEGSDARAAASVAICKLVDPEETSHSPIRQSE
ncbi:unnamed protein product [Cyclocybe aegerita]|uniref:Fungal-type protein kinase domain-containing protein n=1 Tax=Cyclocybe aegerita TaxID=1973307 RepID=A0A8S0VRG0_CYCAE|nr:unnamed protein product [Cyclocybe aegerita]